MSQRWWPAIVVLVSGLVWSGSYFVRLSLPLGTVPNTVITNCSGSVYLERALPPQIKVSIGWQGATAVPAGWYVGELWQGLLLCGVPLAYIPGVFSRSASRRRHEDSRKRRNVRGAAVLVAIGVCWGTGMAMGLVTEVVKALFGETVVFSASWGCVHIGVSICWGIMAGVTAWRILAGYQATGPGHCTACGYNLRGNVSGRCPECGQAVRSPAEDGTRSFPHSPRSRKAEGEAHGI